MDEILDLKRRLAIEGVHNVRDLGGFTRWGRFLRANTMHWPTSADQTALVEYGMRTAVDLRRTNETETEPNVFARSDEVAYHHLNMLGDENLEIESTRRYLKYKCDDPVHRTAAAMGYTTTAAKVICGR